jgi:hypothetical protein
MRSMPVGTFGFYRVNTPGSGPFAAPYLRKAGYAKTESTKGDSLWRVFDLPILVDSEGPFARGCRQKHCPSFGSHLML